MQPARQRFGMAGITFKGGSGQVKYSGIIQIGGKPRISGWITLTSAQPPDSPSQNSAGMRVVNCVNGVIDHSIFDAPSGSVNNAAAGQRLELLFGFAGSG